MSRFNLSTNIIRDSKEKLEYIPTKNADEVYEQIAYGIESGRRAFTIIGSYGTGKSTFLWAIERHLVGDLKFGLNRDAQNLNLGKIEFVRIVGESQPFKQSISDAFSLPKGAMATNKKLLDALEKKITSKTFKDKTILLLVDEFGKHLEYMAKQDVQEMYFLQELAEWCSDTNKNFVIINTLHQNYNAYSSGLRKSERNEWAKIKGRFLEISFDEPVEQLLHFAHRVFAENTIPKAYKKKFLNVSKELSSSNLLTKIENHEIGYADLFPLDPISSGILVKALQQYGQNERSLFTFLESREVKLCLKDERPFTVADCFDYLTKNLSSEIQDGERNPHKPQWKAAFLALEVSEYQFKDEYDSLAKMIKTVCLVNIFGMDSAVLDAATLSIYAEKILEVEDARTCIDKLKRSKILRYVNYRSKLNFVDGTDLDLEQELIEAAKKIDTEVSLTARLNDFYGNPVIPARRIQFEKGTPRFFQVRFVEDLILSEPQGEIDGYVNILFTEYSAEKFFKDHKHDIKNIDSSQVLVLCHTNKVFHDILFKLDKLNFVHAKFADDRVALRIIQSEVIFEQTELKNLIDRTLYSGHSESMFIWKGEEKIIDSRKRLNSLLSDVADKTYNKTPVFKSELANKEFLSTPILTARKALLNRMLDHSQEEDLGFDIKKFPPEKTIYETLLKLTGIHTHQKGSSLFGFGEPNKKSKEGKSFQPLFEECQAILRRSSESKLNIKQFYLELQKAPFKLKKGFLDFWIQAFLIIKKEEYALYNNEDQYIPYLTSETLALIHKRPERFFIKGYDEGSANQYLLKGYQSLEELQSYNFTGLRSTYIGIYSYLLREYRQLTDFAKNTQDLDFVSKEAIQLREAIANATDPESALFSRIPEALGFYNIESKSFSQENFSQALQSALESLRESGYMALVKIETSIGQGLNLSISNNDKPSLDNVREEIESRLKGLEGIEMENKLRQFYKGVTNPIPDSRAYWGGLCMTLMQQKLDSLNDDNIKVFASRVSEQLDVLFQLNAIRLISRNKGKVFLQPMNTESENSRLLKPEIIDLQKVLTDKENNHKDKVVTLTVSALLELTKKGKKS